MKILTRIIDNSPRSTMMERLARCSHNARWVNSDACVSCESFDGFERDENGSITAMVCRSALPNGGVDAEKDARHPAVLTPVWELLPAQSVFAPPDVNAQALLGLMVARGLSAIAVVDAGSAPLGVVSQEELARRLKAGAPEGATPQDTGTLTARDVMMTNVPSVRDCTSVADASMVVAGRNAPYVLVKDEDGAAVGILGAGELLRWYVGLVHD
ncbi:MAG: CBS domain-containing protein [Myxococcota bacterium]